MRLLCAHYALIRGLVEQEPEQERKQEEEEKEEVEVVVVAESGPLEVSDVEEEVEGLEEVGEEEEERGVRMWPITVGTVAYFEEKQYSVFTGGPEWDRVRDFYYRTKRRREAEKERIERVRANREEARRVEKAGGGEGRGAGESKEGKGGIGMGYVGGGFVGNLDEEEEDGGEEGTRVRWRGPRRGRGPEKKEKDTKRKKRSRRRQRKWNWFGACLPKFPTPLQSQNEPEERYGSDSLCFWDCTQN